MSYADKRLVNLICFYKKVLHKRCDLQYIRFWILTTLFVSRSINSWEHCVCSFSVILNIKIICLIIWYAFESLYIIRVKLVGMFLFYFFLCDCDNIFGLYLEFENKRVIQLLFNRYPSNVSNQSKSYILMSTRSCGKAFLKLSKY